MQLRLLILEEVSPRPRLQSLGDLHRELEFFERPDRQSIVREVYERFQRQSNEASVDHAVPVPLLEPPRPKRHHRWWKRRAARLGALVVFLAMLAAGAAWEWSRPEGSWIKARAEESWRAGYDFGRRGVGLAREGWAAAGVRLGLSSRPSVGPSPVKTVGRPVTAAIAGQAEPGAVTPTAEAVPLPLATGGQPVVTEPQPAAAVALQPEKGQPLAAERTQPARIYSAADPGVVPPRLIRPTPEAAADGGVANDSPAVEVEVVVSATGTVESARLVPPGSGPRAATMISAVKAWSFEPATLGGEPVRYRDRLRLPAR